VDPPLDGAWGTRIPCGTRDPRKGVTASGRADRRATLTGGGASDQHAGSQGGGGRGSCRLCRGAVGLYGEPALPRQRARGRLAAAT
jgi:hypothetical protein